MRAILVANDRYLIKYNSRYLVINAETKRIFEALEITNDVYRLSRILNLSVSAVRKKYRFIERKINDLLYYPENISLKYPIKLHWKITPECNLKCRHCYLGELTEKKLSADKILSIGDKIADSNILELTISGGEALTVKELPIVLKKIISKGILVHIFTNGILLPKLLSNLDSFTLKKCLEFEVSVDGLEKEHDAIRGKGSFNKAINGITAALNLGYQVSTNSVISKLNYKSLPKLFVFLKEVGVRTIQFSHLIDSGRATSDMKLSIQEEMDFMNELEQVVKQKPYNTKLIYTSKVNSIIHSVSNGKHLVLGREKWKCGAGIGRATIDYQGDVYCCPFWNKSCLGNILENPLEILWENRNRFLFLKELARLNDQERVCIVARERVCDE